MWNGFRASTIAGSVVIAFATSWAFAGAGPGPAATAEGADPPAVVDMMGAVNARVAKATRIANDIRAASPMGDAQFLELSQALLGAADAGLEGAADANSLKGALAAARGARGVQKELGNIATDFVFKPIVPCRLLDTRANGIKLVANTPFGVDFDGGNPGNAAGCTFGGVAAQTGTIFTGRAALAINLTVTQPSGPGFIQARPVGTTNVTSNQNFVANQDVAAYAVIQDAGTAAEFELFASVATHAVVDVLGVFAPPGPTALECQTVLSNTFPIASGNTFTIGAPACPAGFSVTGPVYNSSSLSVNFVVTALAASGTGSYLCAGSNLTGVSVNVLCGAKCCRVPGG